MKDLWKYLGKIASFLGKSKARLLILDFDGTLSPIVDCPSQAKLPLKTKKLLRKLSEKDGLYLAVLSGRELDDIRKRVGLEGIIYGGDHGLVGEIFNKRYIFPLPKKVTSGIENIKVQLRKFCKKYQGVFLEDKGNVVSFHYRLAGQNEIDEIKEDVERSMKPFLEKGLVTIIFGKKVFDIYPKVDWNKGYFAKLLIKEVRKKTGSFPRTLYVGDDATDEQAFKHLFNQVTVKVGESDTTKALYKLKNTGEVYQFLSFLCRKLK